MKIAFLSHLDANLYLFRLPIMKELIKNGDKVYAVCPKGSYFDRFEDFGIQSIEYKIDRSSLNPIKEAASVNAIYEAIKDLHLDIIHTFTAKPNIYGTFAAKRANIPVIINLVEGLGSFYLENDLKNKIVRFVMERLYKKAFKLSNLSIFVNSDDPKYMISKGIIDKKKIKIIKSVGIDTDEFNDSRIDKNRIKKLKTELNIKNKTVVLMIARAIWHKGVREFYEAAERLKDSDTVFILVGDMDEGNHFSATKEFLRNSDVLWLGFREDIKELISICDIFVLPSYREGVPRTLLEAASMAKPIVTTDAVGCKEVVENGKNGFLVPVKDVEKLSKSIEKLLRDEDLRKKMGKYGREKAIREFDIKKIVKEYMDVYKSF